jgi:hypothetical protein
VVGTASMPTLAAAAEKSFAVDSSAGKLLEAV